MVQYKVTSIIQFGLVMVFLLLNIYIFFYNYFTIGDIAFSPGDSIENLLLLNLSRSILLLFASFSAFVIITKVEEVFWRKYSYIISLVYTVLSLFIVISINLNHNLKVVEINNDFGIDIDLLSELIDTTKLEELNGEVVDRTKSEYLLIKKQLQGFIDKTASYKYIYIYGLNERNEVVAFIEVSASSYASEAKDFLPGDIYNEPSDEMLDSLTMQKSNNEGPIRDEFGLWYSHFAPLKVNGERLMIVGADMSADDFESKIYNDQVIILAFILFISFIVFISDDTTSLNFTKIEIYSLAINRFKLLFGLYADSVLIIENDIIIDCNSEAVKFFNYRKVKIIGMDFINLATSNESSKKELLTLFDSYLETIKKGENVIFEWTFIINKKEKFAEITLTKFVDAKYKGYQILIHDISDRKKKEDETKKEINELEKLNKIMIGRELKMIELKKEIRDLKNTFKGNL
jgi:PAS domain S-box-containing protein